MKSTGIPRTDGPSAAIAGKEVAASAHANIHCADARRAANAKVMVILGTAGKRAILSSVRPPLADQLLERREQIHRHGKHDGRALVAGDASQRLQVAQLHRLRLPRQHLRRLQQLLRGLQLAVGVDDLGAPRALGFGLLRNRAHHGGVDVHVLDLDGGHLDAPRVGLRIEDLLDIEVELVALGEQLVELVLAEHRAQGGLRELARRLEEIRYLDDRLLRIHHAEIDDRVHLHRHVVARDHILARNVQHHGAQVHAHHLLDAGHDDDEARSLDPPEAAEQEHDAALVLAQDAQRREDEYADENDYAANAELFDHDAPPRLFSGSTRRVRPSIPVTRNLSPRASGAALTTRQVSPRTCAQPSRSKSERAVPLAPMISALPLTTGRRRALSANHTVAKVNVALATVKVAMNE